MANPLQFLIDKIKEDPVAFSQTPVGKTFTAAYNLVPSKYDTDDYTAPKGKQPVRIVFTGMGDSQFTDYARSRFAKKYPNNLYVFGHPQLQEAQQFAKSIDKDTPVIVYGYSWGSNAARKFIDQYKGNIVGAHFLDPMRKDMHDWSTLQIKRKIPVTYTPAGQYKNQELKQTLLNALRWKPAKTMRVLKRVKDHAAVQQWLDQLEQPTMVKAAARGYGSILRYI